MAEAIARQLGAVGPAPAHHALIDDVHSPPDEAAGHAETGEDLRHLAVVAEHVAHETGVRRLPAELARNVTAEGDIAHQRLAGDEELVGQHIPGADDELAFSGEALDLAAALRPHLQVVFQDDRLAVALEGAAQLIALPAGDDPIQQANQPVAVVLEGLIPLTVPVSAEDVVDATWGHGSSPFVVGIRIPGRSISDISGGHVVCASKCGALAIRDLAEASVEQSAASSDSRG